MWIIEYICTKKSSKLSLEPYTLIVPGAGVEPARPLLDTGF